MIVGQNEQNQAIPKKSEVGLKEKDLHKIIRNNGERDNTLLVNALNAAHPELTTAEANKRNRRNRTYKRLTAVLSTLSVAEALALILIPTLSLSGGNSSLPPDGGATNTQNYGLLCGYGGGSPDYNEIRINGSIQEYNQTYNSSFLFFSTVDYDYRLYEYRNFSDEFLCLNVSFIFNYYDEHIDYNVCAKGVTMDFLSYRIDICTQQSVISDCIVKWGETPYDSSYGIFSYGNYDYYIYVNSNRDRLFQLIQDLLEDN